MIKNIYFYESDIGKIWIAENGQAITNLYYDGKDGDGEAIPRDACVRETPLLKEAGGQIGEYLSGKRRSFALPLDPCGTGFQRKVWKALLEIPYGQTRTYGEIAKRTGNERAARAVGMANHKNPVPIIIPCHRVVGSKGKLVGFAWGLELKERLLELE